MIDWSLKKKKNSAENMQKSSLNS